MQLELEKKLNDAAICSDTYLNHKSNKDTQIYRQPKTKSKIIAEIKNGSKHKIYWEAELLVKDEFGYIIERATQKQSATLESNRIFNYSYVWNGSAGLIGQQDFYYNWQLSNDPVTDLVVEDITLRTIQLIKAD